MSQFLLGNFLCRMFVAITFIVYSESVAAQTHGSAAPCGPQTHSPTIRRLIDDLDSDDYQVRDSSYRHLAGLDEALPVLRRLSTFASLESRRRVEQLIKSHIAKRGVRRVEAMVKRRDDAELDLLVDCFVQNPYAVDDNAWRFVAQLADGMWKKHGKPTALRPPPVLGNCLDLPITRADTVADRHAASLHRVLCRTLAVDRAGLSRTFALCAGPCKVDNILMDSVIFATNSFVLDDGNPGSRITGSIVFADGDVACHMIRQSVIIATGRIKYSVSIDSALFPNVSPGAGPVPLFDMRVTGLSVRADPGALVVDSVVPDSAFGAAQVRRGDRIRKINGALPKDVADGVRFVRSGLASPLDLELAVERAQQLVELSIASRVR